MARMNDQWQQALADVVRSELGLRGKTAKEAYTTLGISSTAWQSYFKTRNRDIPSRVLLAVADYLDMTLSHLSVKTEARQAQLIRAELEGGLSSSNRRALEDIRPPERDEDREDPPAPGSERGRHSA